MGGAVDAGTRQRESSAAAFARRGSVRPSTRADWERFRAAGRPGAARAGGGAAALSGGSSLVPRTPHPKPANAVTCAEVPQYNAVRVKFVEGTSIRLSANGALYSDNGPAMTPALDAELALINARPDTQHHTTLATPVAELLWSKEDAEKESGEEHADPTLWFDMLDGTSLVEVAGDAVVCDRTAALVNWLNAMQIVEVAYPIPASEEPPSIPWMNPGYDLVSPSTVREPPHMLPWNPMGNAFGVNSPEVSSRLDPAFRTMWQGQDVDFVDMEYSWFWHEKIGDVYRIPGGALSSDASWMNHAVACMSIAFGAGRSNNDTSGLRYATRGLAPLVRRGFSANIGVVGQNTPDGVERAQRTIERDDVILVEAQYDSPIFVSGVRIRTAVEAEAATYDVIRRATANGRVVIEPTGNARAGGTNDIDFTIGWRTNSGALVVGANNGAAQAGMPMPGSGFGSRVDANAWGAAVQAAASWNYIPGNNLDSPPGTPNNQSYTLGFSGSSSASAIVSGAVAQMVGVHNGAFYRELAPPARVAATVRSLINAGGTPPVVANGRSYGTQPNVERTVTEFILATRIHPFAPYVSAPHDTWMGTYAYPGILPISAWSDGVWLTAQQGTGVIAWEWAFNGPIGPLDLGFNPDSSFTIEARISVPAATDLWQTIVAKENPRNFGLWIAPTSYNSGRLHFSYQPDGSTSHCGSYSNAVVADGLVHHVAVRFDHRGEDPFRPTTITFFIDGVADNTVGGCAGVFGYPAASGGVGENIMFIASNMALWSLVGDVRLYHYFVNNADIANHANGS